jgi:hypothetical protein
MQNQNRKNCITQYYKNKKNSLLNTRIKKQKNREKKRKKKERKKQNKTNQKLKHQATYFTTSKFY